MALKILSFSLAAVLCLLISHKMAGERGIAGAGIGIGIGAVLCAVSYLLLVWARKAKGKAVMAAMLAGSLTSIVLILISILLVAAFWREVVEPAALTAVVVYLAFRFLDVFQVSKSISTKQLEPSAGVSTRRSAGKDGRGERRSDLP